MAQQTQVDRVIPKWHAFLERFPTPAHAAAARAGELIEMWDGLGYNRRALLLHRCAVHITNEHDGEFPTSLEDLLALPGVGPYTARAVQAFAFELDVAVVDTNVGRVIARLTGTTMQLAEVQRRADALVAEGSGWEWNQALLDFGATVCAKRAPRCETCPAKSLCSWAGVGADPAVGSAAVSVQQSTFAGSNREARGKLVRHLRSGSLAVDDVRTVCGLDDDPKRSEQILASLLADGMVIELNGVLSLP